ncbi:hypothetical protein A6A27_14465 [Micromonospora sp. CB01531]|nr:hypothetical protein [Micromonospora sp. CB01531]OKI87653.1 hypothetical protein A6A27_14465 [Micromonospora sp. CB01531]
MAAPPGVEQAPGGEPVPGGGPLLGRPPAAGEDLDRGGTDGGEGDQRLGRVEPGGEQGRQVPIAAVFAQDRGGLPEDEVRRVRPGQVGVGGRQRTPGQVGGPGRPAGQRGGLGQLG